MCLAVPAKVESIDRGSGVVALDENRTTVQMALVPEASVGDWVLVHAGMAITVLDEAEAMETYDLLRQGDEIRARQAAGGSAEQTRGEQARPRG